MADLISFSLGGLAFILIGAHESLSPFFSPFSISSSSAAATTNLSFRYISSLSLSLLSILNSLFSSLSALRRHDPIGVPLQLSFLSFTSLFLLYSLAGLLSSSRSPLRLLLLPLPSSFFDLLLFSAFGLELLFLYFTQRKDPSGIENRYFDLLLVPVLVCAISTLLALARPSSPFPPLARGVGLVLHGTWLVQMGFSFFSSAIAHGCFLHESSRGNFTIKCKGHPEYHRSRAIATLQFNCHLAFLVLVAAGAYSFVSGRMTGVAMGDEYSKYRPLGVVQRTGDYHVASSNFTLDSDDEEEEQVREVASSVEIAMEVQRPKEQNREEAVVNMP